MPNFNFTLIINSILLGIGLAMDAFSVSLANGMNDPNMKKGKTVGIATTFGVFQFAMPLIGWVCVTTIAKLFTAFEKFIPFIALILLCFIGGKMIYECVKNKDCQCEKCKTTFLALMVQGVATSIDALSVGFTISSYNLKEAIISCLIIGVVTFGICLVGLFIGKIAGDKLKNKAGIIGGIILIVIGIEILVTSFIWWWYIKSLVDG